MVRAKTILTIGGLQSTTDEAQIRGALRLTGSSGPDPTPPKKVNKTAAQMVGEHAAVIRKETAGKTPVQIVRERAVRTQALQRAAGTFGKDVGPLVERKRIQELTTRVQRGKGTERELKELQTAGLIRATTTSAFIPPTPPTKAPPKQLRQLVGAQRVVRPRDVISATTQVKPVTLVQSAIAIDEGLKTITRPLLKDTEQAAELVSSLGRTTQKAKERFLPRLPSPEIVRSTREIRREIAVGVAEGAIIDVREQPLKQIALVGAGFGIGAGLRTARAVAKPIAGLRGVKIIKTAAKVGGAGVGVVFGAETAVRAAASPTPREFGSVLGVAAKDIGLIGAGVKAEALLNNPIVTRVPTRAIRDAEFKEVKFRVAKEGKVLDIGKFEIVGETAPPIKVTKTTRLRKLIGDAPISEKIIPPKISKAFLPEFAVNSKPFTVVEIQKGSKIAKIKEISGFSKEIAPSTDFLSPTELAKVEKFAIQKGIEQKIGRPISSKNLAKFFPKETQLSRASIRATEFGKIDVGKKLFTAKPAGRRVVRSISVSRIDPFLETEVTKVSTIKTFFKDVTKPLSRATGKTPRLKGTITEFKRIIPLDKFTPTVIPKGKITKTPFSKTFQETITKTVRPLPKVSLDVKIPSPTARTIKSPSLKSLTATGITGLVPKGITRSIAKTSPKDITKIISIPKLQPISIQRIKEITKLKTKPKLKPKEKIKVALEPKTIIKQKIKIKTKLKLKQKLKPKEKLKVPFISIPSTRIPTSSTPFIGFGFSGLQRPGKKIKSKVDNDLTLAEGFTARAIGLAPERLTTKQARARALKPEGLGLSRAPIIIDIDKKPRRKVKKKTKGRKKR